MPQTVIIEAIARALDLDDDDRVHLYGAAGVVGSGVGGRQYAETLITIASVDAVTEPALAPLPVAEAAYGLEEKARGAIFTRRAVVDFMLDLIGYTTDRPLHELTILEPPLGGGRFVLAVADRLLAA